MVESITMRTKSKIMYPRLLTRISATTNVPGQMVSHCREESMPLRIYSPVFVPPHIAAGMTVLCAQVLHGGFECGAAVLLIGQGGMIVLLRD